MNDHRSVRISSNQGGFTLIELAAALAILTFGLLMIGAMQIMALQTNAHAGNMMGATTLAQDKLEQLLALSYTDAALTDTDPTHTTVATSYTDPGNPIDKVYTRTWTINDNIPETNTKTIIVTVTWSYRGLTRTFTLTGVKVAI